MTTDIKQLLYQDIANSKLLDWNKTKRRWGKALGRIPKNSEIFEVYQEMVIEGLIPTNAILEKSLKIRKIRTLSGVAPFAVMMKPFYCPGKCVYCVLEPGMPKSYMSDEPAAARAKKLQFDPKTQISTRIQQMEATGHLPEKLEIIVIGGTFSAYENDYKKEFLKDIFDECNKLSLTRDFPDETYIIPKTIAESQKINETSKYRIIGLSVETRPDWITDEEIILLREYGVTRVQLGVQSLDEKINTLTQRGHDIEAVKMATKKLRDSGFKISYHFMPNLPGSTPQRDVEMCQEMFDDENFRPDSLKIYPCIVIPNTALWVWWKRGEYKSYDDETLTDVLVKCVECVPKYCRIDRLVRDITRNWTASGTIKTNMRQLVDVKMKNLDLVPMDIRAREVRDREYISESVKLDVLTYQANQGTEHFIQFCDEKYLYGLLRLRFPNKNDKPLFPVLENSAVIRELHVFGQQLPVHTKAEVSPLASEIPQHRSLGKNLILEAEKMAREAGFTKIAIISGVGVREYYRKLGYTLIESYMVKEL